MQSIDSPSADASCASPQASSIPASVTCSAGNNQLFLSLFEGLVSQDEEGAQFASHLQPKTIIQLSWSIRTTLKSAGSFAPVLKIQAHNDFPLGFAIALNVATVFAYCPEFRSCLQLADMQQYYRRQHSEYMSLMQKREQSQTIGHFEWDDASDLKI